MNATLDLPNLERKAYETLWEDGLVDVFAALGLLAMGAAWVSGQAVFGGVAPALLVPIWAATRRRVSLPRAGYVRFSPERRSLQRRHLGSLTLLGAVTLVLGVLIYLRMRSGPGTADELLRMLIPGLPAVLLGVGAFLIAVLFGIRRFLFYTVVLALVGGLGVVFEVKPGWHFLAAGAVMLAVGLTVLIGFLRQNPLPGAESTP